MACMAIIIIIADGNCNYVKCFFYYRDMGSSSSLVTSPDDYNLSVSQSDITGNDQSRIDN